LPAQDAGKRFYECCILVGNFIRQQEYTAVHINGWQPNILGKTAGVKVCLTQCITNGGMPSQAVMTRVAWDMMCRRYSVTLFVALHSIAHSRNLAAYFMTQYQRGPVQAVPLHHIAAADAAGLYTHQKLTGTDLRGRPFLYPHISVAVPNRNANSILS
jgi:hypothetical protein